MNKPLTKTQRYLIHARTRAGLTQAEAAKMVGCSLRAYQSWEQGFRQPKEYVLEAAVKTLRELH